jgi:Ca2+-binding EF-hand superfamily protein
MTRELARSKLFQQFDLNHDGKITQAEIDKVLSARFAAASGGSSTLTERQFADMRLDEVHKRSDLMFRKIDWNADGKISRDEFVNAEHARFNRMDRRASGEVACAPHAHAVKADDSKDESASRPHRHPGFHHARGKGFCAQFDANKDGKVTRAEFDRASNAQFDKFAKAGAITPDGFFQMTALKVRDRQARRFARLDADHTGKLTLAEFEAPQKKMFARLDKNKDGAITPDEVAAAMHHRFGKGMHGDWHGHGKPGEKSPG